jgi:hypothetical protein
VALEDKNEKIDKIGVPSEPAVEPLTAPQLPGPGELCPEAACQDNAVCLGGICHRKCAQAVPSCNDVVKGCASDEVCMPATSFTDACFAATARTGEPCGASAEGAICRAGNLCVYGPDDRAYCMKLCRYNCPEAQCVETTSGCAVCLPF